MRLDAANVADKSKRENHLLHQTGLQDGGRRWAQLHFLASADG